MTTIKPCLTGCTIRGQHTPTCETRNHPTNPCRGCVPRQAEYGNLCPWCWQRLHADIIDTAPLVRYLRADPGTETPQPGTGRSATDPAYRSILSPAIDAADGLHSALAAYAQIILEDHPHGRVMVGPDQRGVVITQTTIHRDEYGVYVQKATVAGIRDAEATARLVKWLLPFLPWCSEQDWAGVMRTEISDLVATTKARWPIADTRTRRIGDILCPRCDRASLTYTPTSHYRGPFVVACTNPDCGRSFSEDEWERLISLLGLAGRRVG